MKIGDLICLRDAPAMQGPAFRVGLVIGKSFSSYNGALLKILWPDKAHPMWEPKKYLEKVSEGR